MTILTEFPGIEGLVEYLLFAFYHNDIDNHIFINFRHIEFVWISWPCLVVSRLHDNDAGVSGLLFTDVLWFFSLFLRLVFSSDPPTGKSGDAFEAKRKRQMEGWPLAMEWRVKTRVQQSTIKKELFQSFIICKKKIWEYTLVDMSYLEWNINWKPLIMEYWCLGDGIADRIVTQGLFPRGCFALHQRVI